MDTVFVQSFVAVVDAGSIAEAARRLDLAPTTVAQQIRALEHGFGARLLQRSGRTVRPTVAGTRILERCRALLKDVRDIYSTASNTGLPAGPLRLGATPTALMGLLPNYLRDWKRVHPEVAIYIEPGTSAVLLGNVTAGILDAAIVVHPAFELPKSCAWKQLREESLILLTPASLEVKDPIQIASTEAFIRYDRRVVAGRMAHDYLNARGISPKVQFELDGIEHIAQLVAEGFGVSVLPDWPVVGSLDPRVRRWELPSPCPSRKVGIVWTRGAARSELADEFVSVACS